MRQRWWIAAPVLLAVAFVAWRYFFPQPPRGVQLRPEAGVSARGSVLLIAPHPDDEVLAAGGLVQETIARGGRVHVVMVTNGDGFRIAAEKWLGHLSPTAAEMIAFGRHRQQETLDALKSLGVGAESVRFLGYPDEGIAHLWLENWTQPYRSPFTAVDISPYQAGVHPYTGRALLDELITVIEQERPSRVVYPHPQDAHPDHWAVHNFTLAALEALRNRWPPGLAPSERLYLVHRGDWPAPKGLLPQADLLPPAALVHGITTWATDPLTPEQVRRKEQAIRRYPSQVTIMERYLLSFARKTELFGTIEPVPLPSLPALPGPPPWTPMEIDPAGDTVLRELVPAADVLGLDAARSGDDLYVRVRLRGAPSTREVYALHIRGYRSSAGWADELHLVWRRGGPNLPGGVTATVSGESVVLRVPLARLHQPEAIILGAQTSFEGRYADRTGYRLVRLP